MNARLARLLCLALFGLSPLVAQALPEQTWLVAIGNNHGAAADVSLLYAERDARELTEVFHQQAHISSRRTMLLLGEDADTVRRALQDVNAAIRAHSPREPTALIIFYSGHADAASLHLAGTELALDELKTIAEGSSAGMRLLVVDACRSGTVTRVKGVHPAENFRIDVRNEAAPEGMAIITSSAADESSQESDNLRGSFFTHHLINALRGAADKNGDGEVTLTEAYSYAYTETLRSSGQTMALQHPTYSWAVKGREQLVLSQPGLNQGHLGRLRFRDASTYLIMEKRDGGPIVAEVSPQGERGELVLPPGDYFVQQRERNEFREYQVALAAGGEVDLATIPYRSVRYDRLVRRRGGGPQEHAQGLTFLLGAQGGMLAGEYVMPQLQLGYGFDFDWGSLGVRLRSATIGGSGGDGLLPQRHDEFALGLTLQRFIDFSHVSLAFGVLVESEYHHQSFDSSRNVSPRSTFGGGFGGLFSVETHIGGGFALRFEGGPLTSVFKRATVTDGVATGTETATPLTWWAAGGIVWRH